MSIPGIVPGESSATDESAPVVRQIEIQTQTRRYALLYREACLPDAEWQRCKLEALRYKWGHYRHAVRFMQRLGDVGRKLIGAVVQPRV